MIKLWHFIIAGSGNLPPSKIRYSILYVSVMNGRYDLWLASSVMSSPQKSCRNMRAMDVHMLQSILVTSLLRTIATKSSKTNVLSGIAGP